jgi:hypothetical protein
VIDYPFICVVRIARRFNYYLRCKDNAAPEEKWGGG